LANLLFIFFLFSYAVVAVAAVSLVPAVELEGQTASM
jgi:hypothetical protein